MFQINPADEYLLDELGRICPVHQMGCAREGWKDASSFEELMEGVAAVAMADVFPDEDLELGPEELSDLQAKRYLDIADGFYLATAIDGSLGVFRFMWQGEMFFTMRPDFFFLSLVSHVGEPPINTLESAIRDRLINYYRELDALKYALARGEIEATGVYPIDWWREFWSVRGFSTPDPFVEVTASGPINDEPLKTRELNSLLTIIAALCNYSRIKHDDRGVAARIKKMTDDIGAAVSEETILKWLDKIPDALERRMK